MAEWRPLHQQLSLRGGLETGGQTFNPPLLPYEKALIETIGCTEEEYKTFVRHAMLRQRVRPAEYDHIPDVVNDPVTAVVVNIVVGLLFTAASLLLAPKPPSFDNDKKITKKKLADQVGPSSFNQTSSFDNAPSLAELNQPIPIPFGKRSTGSDGLQTGGLVLVPALVWSRLYAYGTYTAYEGVYVAGEAGIDSPELSGILHGTSSLSSLGSRDFALYWSSKSGSNRPSALLFGTEGTHDSGTVARQVFSAPDGSEEFGDGFSQAYVPSGDTTFGVSSPIHNGTAYKFNWQVISAPFSATKGEDQRTTGDEVRAQRRKIAGTAADVLHLENGQHGMPGVGRAYSRRMGFIGHQKVGQSTSTTELEKKIISANLGDLFVFEIYNDDESWDLLVAAEAEGFLGTEVNLEDLKNSANAWRQRASDLLVVGSRWMVGGVGLMVQGRQDLTNRINVTLVCVSNSGSAQIGIPGARTIREALGGYDGNEDVALGEKKYCREWYFNLVRQHIATIRPVRRNATVIELGIRSQVWNRASGLCNFNAVPSPDKLLHLDASDITVETGRIDKYFQRSSCFSVFVRPVANVGETQRPFEPIDRIFCVQGNSPITQNNYLRIRPNGQDFYEYRLIPRPGSELVQFDENTEITVLQATEGVPYKRGGGGTVGETLSAGPYGSFRITTQGKKTILGDIVQNPEFHTNPSKTKFISETVDTNVPSHMVFVKSDTKTGHKRLHYHAFLTHFLGPAAQSKDQTVATPYTIAVSDTKSITFNIQGTSGKGVGGTDFGEEYLRANGDRSPYIWFDAQVKFPVTEATGDWQLHEEVTIRVYGVSNRFSRYVEREYDETYGFIDVTVKVGGFNQVSTVISTEVANDAESRMFEEYSQVSDCSFYTEVTKSCDQGPEHSISYVNEFLSNKQIGNREQAPQYDDMSTVGFAVKSSGEVSGIEQLRLCCSDGIKVEKLRFAERGTIGSSNNFADLVHYLLTSKTQGVGNTVPAELVDKDSLGTTADFLHHNKIFFDGVLEDAESFRSFLYDTAPLQLCTFTIKNGKFGMQPALPFYSISHTDNDGNITRKEGTQINYKSPVKAEQIFTAGNIIEDTLQVQYIDFSQRSNIRGLVTWRVTRENDLPYKASALLYWADLNDANTTEQSFDLSEFCTNREQALKTARFLMSTRRRITKTISFKTVPDALSVQPGSYIRVITEANTYSSSANGVVTDAGDLVSVVPIESGTYDAIFYFPSEQRIQERKIVISTINGRSRLVDSSGATDNTLFTLLSNAYDRSVYQIDSLNLEEDGLVSISAVEVPTDSYGRSIVARDVIDESNTIFKVIE